MEPKLCITHLDIAQKKRQYIIPDRVTNRPFWILTAGIAYYHFLVRYQGPSSYCVYVFPSREMKDFVLMLCPNSGGPSEDVLSEMALPQIGSWDSHGVYGLSVGYKTHLLMKRRILRMPPLLKAGERKSHHEGC